jgi:hypothetical protein
VNLAITVGVFFVLEGWRKNGEEVEGLPSIFPNGAAVARVWIRWLPRQPNSQFA